MSTPDNTATDDPRSVLPPERANEMQRQQQAAAAYVQKVWTAPNKQCPICSSNTWTTTDVQQFLQFNQGAVMLGGPVVPVFMLVCNVCGYMHMFSAVKAGILETPNAAGTEQGAEGNKAP